MRKWRRRQTKQARHDERAWPAYLLVAGTGFEPMIFGFATRRVGCTYIHRGLRYALLVCPLALRETRRPGASDAQKPRTRASIEESVPLRFSDRQSS